MRSLLMAAAMAAALTAQAADKVKIGFISTLSGPNASIGTDHGSGNVMFVVGKGINGGKVVGDLALGALVDGDLPIDFGVRSFNSGASPGNCRG